MAKITATFIKTLNDWRGDARLYELSQPVAYDGESSEPEHAHHVVVSAVNVTHSGPETFIFPARADGSVRDFGEMPGSFSGALDHERAIREAGWVLA